MIDYWNNDTSLEYKMKVIKMINELNINQKVGEIAIKLNNNNPINEEMIRMMISNYNNVYRICLYDSNNSVDNSIHD